MIDFAEYLTPGASLTSRRAKPAKWAADLLAVDAGPILWRCAHAHETQEQALACANSALRCDPATPLGNDVKTAIKGYFWLKEGA